MTIATESNVENIQPSVKKDEVVAKILKSTEDRIREYEEDHHIFGTRTDTIDYMEMKEALEWKETLAGAIDEYLNIYKLLWENELNYVSKQVQRLDIWIGVSDRYLQCSINSIGTKMRWYYDARTLIDALKNNASEPNEKEERTCPKCGGKLIERNGIYGKFLGCENYPDCRYTESL